MERRLFIRMKIPGTTLQYKKLTSNKMYRPLSVAKPVANISRFGLAFQSAEPLESGESLYLKISFPDGKSLRLKGCILWQCSNDSGSNPEVGVQFFPFGTFRKHNPISALQYLRNMIDLMARRAQIN